MDLQITCIFQPREVTVNNIEFNSDFISRIIPKVEWPALYKAAESVSILNDKLHLIQKLLWRSVTALSAVVLSYNKIV